MKTRDLASCATMTVLVCVLLSAIDISAEKKVVSFDGEVHSLDFSKAVPGQLNYQGFLANSADSSAVTATLQMTFRLFDSETKGVELWSETHSAVEVNNGLFHVLLGSVTPFPDGLFDGSSMWLQTEVESEILEPRKPLVSVAYSHRTNSAEMLEDNTLTDLDGRWVNEEDLDHLDAADGDPDEAVYVDADGKVGVGTTSPLTELDVNGSVNATTYYGDGSNLTGIAGTPDADWTISGSHMYSAVPGSVGVGTSSPENKFHVAGDVKATTYYGDGSNLTGISGTTDNDWTIRGDTVYHETGPVGIGTSSPSAPLTIQTIAGTDVEFSSSGSNADMVAPVQFNLGTSGPFPLHLQTSSSARLAIDGTGQVGIGTTSPTQQLDVNGAINATTYYGDGSNLTGISGTADNDWTISGNDIYSALPGNVGIGTSSPAEKLAVSGNIQASGTIKSGSSITIDGVNNRVTSSGDLKLHVISGLALRLDPHATSPNLIGGYSGNSVTEGIYGATIGGGGSSGSVNSVTGNYSTVSGGQGNTASSDRAFIGGGQDNTVSSSFTTVGGGWSNQASQPYAVVCGGGNNHAYGSESFVGGGSGNVAGASACVGGGSGNAAHVQGGVIGGGLGNLVSDEYGTVGGGQNNKAGDAAGTTDDAKGATVGGGEFNEATKNYATIGGGWDNWATGTYATISGGESNQASGGAAIGGGYANHAYNSLTTIGGGFENLADAFCATVGGGYSNSATGEHATVPGGSLNRATGNHSFAAGRRAKANHHGCFVWADSTDADFGSNIPNEFKVRAENGMYVIGNNASYGALINNDSGGGDGLRVSADVSEGYNWGALFAINFGTSPAIYAYADTAGYFHGHVKVTGNIVKGGGGFQIDHPLDPDNKYLNHFSMESPDMKNVYDGVVVLNSQGDAWVELPEWFGSLNRDFRYQLTALGAPGPDLHIAEKISGNRFKIAGGQPGMEVSWQVTGIRQDAFANAHRIPIEKDKSGQERGKYLHAKEHGLPETMEIGYEARLKKENK